MWTSFWKVRENFQKTIKMCLFLENLGKCKIFVQNVGKMFEHLWKFVEMYENVATN